MIDFGKSSHFMKFAYVLVPSAVISGNSNGVKAQALNWKSGLEKLGHKVDEINVWDNYKWEEYDLIHIFGTGLWLYDFVKILSSKNPNIVISPIIDSIQTPFMYKLSTYIGFSKFRLWSPTYALKKSVPYFKAIFVRSKYESLYFINSMDVNPDKIVMIPLAIDSLKDNISSDKDNFCLHISSIYQERKNVLRLVKAAKKFNFKLVLAGSKGSEKDFLSINKEIGENSKNIEVLGFITDEEMSNLYSKAKVFALPSISEGVGIVALNAAVYGCEIVITKLGGPKEYYNGMANLVNPYDIDNIGETILKVMNNSVSNQPNLMKYVVDNYSKEIIIKKLEFAYNKIIKSNCLK